MPDLTNFTPKDTWDIKRRSNILAPFPFGYKADPNDVTIWVPDLEQIYHLEYMMDRLDNDESSYRELAEELSSVLPKPISHSSVKNIWLRHRAETTQSLKLAASKVRKKKYKPASPAEKKKQQLLKTIAGKKRSITVAKKKVESIDEFLGKSSEDIDFIGSAIEPSNKDPLEGKNIIFKPNEGPQTDFLASSEQEVLYGGQAGGGKSYALLADPMRYFNNPNFVGILFRRTNDELRELKMKSHMLYKPLFPEAKWREQESVWVFPSGARYWFTYLDKDSDVMRYQGQAFSYIAFDELTQHPTPYVYDYMRSRLRTSDPTLPLFMRATTNPGGPGHGWVKRMFIDPAPPNTPFPATDHNTGNVIVYPEGHKNAGKPLFFRKFIPAKLSDNPHLAQDGRYEASLLSLPENLRRQLLEGDWSLAEGAAFPEFRNAEPYVIEPYEIPETWRRFRSCDYGYTSYSAVHWYAIDPHYETLIVYRELYVSKKTGRDLAKLILSLEKNEKILYGVLDSSVWHQRGQTGPSIAEEIIAEGCRFRPSDRTSGARVNGRNRLHELLKLTNVGFDRDGNEIKKPGIQFFNTCRQIIADLQVIPTDPRGGDDIDDRFPSDHTYDSIRYGIMSRPRGRTPFDWGDSSESGNSAYKPFDEVFGY